MGIKIKCACCGHLTLGGMFDICPVCYWQSDSVQEQEINDDGGPNSTSLRIARVNYATFGAISIEFKDLVRLPKIEELSN